MGKGAEGSRGMRRGISGCEGWGEGEGEGLCVRVGRVWLRGWKRGKGIVGNKAGGTEKKAGKVEGSIRELI